MRATGRRIGRIVGQLDDIAVLAGAYRYAERSAEDEDYDLMLRLESLANGAATLREEAEAIAAAINGGGK